MLMITETLGYRLFQLVSIRPIDDDRAHGVSSVTAGSGPLTVGGGGAGLVGVAHTDNHVLRSGRVRGVDEKDAAGLSSTGRISPASRGHKKSVACNESMDGATAENSPSATQDPVCSSAHRFLPVVLVTQVLQVSIQMLSMRLGDHRAWSESTPVADSEPTAPDSWA